MSQKGLHNNFDHLIRQKLDQHELPVTDELWGKIEAQRAIDNSKSNKKIYALILSFLALMTTVSLWLYRTEVSSQNKTTEIPVVPSLKNEQKARKKAMASIDGKIFAETKDENKHAFIISKAVHSQSNLETKFKKEAQVNRLDNELSFNEKTSGSALIRNTATTENSNRNLKADSELLFVEASNPDLVTAQSYLESTESELIPLDSKLVQLSANRKKIICPGQSFKRATEKLSIELAAGPALSFHQLLANTESDDYLRVRENSEQALVNYGVNFKIKREWANKLTAAAGLNITTFNYRYLFVDSNEIRTTTIRIDTIYHGQSIEVSIDTLSEVSYGIDSRKLYNRHKVISFPLSVGYTFKAGNMFVEPYGGLTLNWQQNVEGDISSYESFRPVNVNTHGGKEIVYKDRLGLIYHFGVTLAYAVNSQFSVIVQPEYHNVIKPITSPDYQITEKRNWVNINIGLKYTLWERKKIRL